MKQGQFIHPKQLYRAKRALQRERCRSLDRYLVEIKGVEKESVRSFWVWAADLEDAREEAQGRLEAGEIITTLYVCPAGQRISA